ncbi:hypothetical protein ABZU45_31310, partial [Streptomyces avermitilis]|uniref:hypothetical protein n=1 Tax=Streptomyces avermitilis TaxID=33903 RepID=UPI0033AD5244
HLLVPGLDELWLVLRVYAVHPSACRPARERYGPDSALRVPALDVAPQARHSAPRTHEYDPPPRLRHHASGTHLRRHT